jgi:hypothetical protein
MGLSRQGCGFEGARRFSAKQGLWDFESDRSVVVADVSEALPSERSGALSRFCPATDLK